MNSNSPHAVWDGAPQCPDCDGPLAYYTADGEDEVDWDGETPDPCGEILCCQCSWGYFTTDNTEGGVLDKLFARVRRDRVSVYKFRSEKE